MVDNSVQNTATMQDEEGQHDLPNEYLCEKNCGEIIEYATNETQVELSYSDREM